MKYEKHEIVVIEFEESICQCDSSANSKADAAEISLSDIIGK